MASIARDDSIAAALPERRFAGGFGWVAGWTTVALFFASLHFLETRYADIPVALPHAIAAALVCWGWWALLGRLALPLLAR